jgi:hypothetical protein
MAPPRVRNRKANPDNDPLEIPYPKRIELAVEAYNKALAAYQLNPDSKPPSVHGIGRSFNVAYTTLDGRIKGGAVSKKEANIAKQRLTPGEEQAIRRHVLQLEAWNWPPLPRQLLNMANELLRAKGVDTEKEPIGKNWLYRFYERHPDIASRYASPIDHNRTAAADEAQIRRHFKLFKKTKEKFNIHDDDVYNMDEKGCAMGVIGKLKVVVSRSTKNVHLTQPGDREWASLIECISSDGRKLTPWVIFKCKELLRRWANLWPEGHIAKSNRGWTDNELCLEWLKLCFEPETSRVQKGEYRMLIFDGHESHINRGVVQFCEEHKIVLFCLPSHSTHLLQPLDIGTSF